MGGSTSSDTKTTTQQLTPEQQSLIGMAMPNAEAFNNADIKMPGSAAVAQFDPLQTQGQDQVLGATGDAGSIVKGAGGANQFLTSGAALDPATNPSLAAWQKSAVRPIYDNLNDVTLPGLAADSSTGAGGVSANFGGSRQGIAQGLATRSANDAAASTEASIANAGYGSGLNAMLTATGQAPTTAAAQSIPGTMTSTVGDIRQGLNQQNLSADASAKQFADFLPQLKALFSAGLASGIPGGSTTSTGTGNKSADPLSTLIGGASAAGGLAGGLAKLAPFLMV